MQSPGPPTTAASAAAPFSTPASSTPTSDTSADSTPASSAPESSGPLSREELQQLESTLLPALERHHLRLLAHGLRTLQAIAGRHHGEAPELEAIRAWAGRQEAIADDDAFAEAFSQQLLGVSRQLQAIAHARHRPLLDLELDELIGWMQQQADARLGPCDHHGSIRPGQTP